MTPYAQSKIFTPHALRLWREATKLVEAIPDDGTKWRCHEVARAVAFRLPPLFAVDGKCGPVEHTWLELEGEGILDVYVPGALPQVQLLDVWRILPWGDKYVAGVRERNDIRDDDIKRIHSYWMDL